MAEKGGSKRPAPPPPPPRPPNEEVDEEEQVEKFCALLHNIKAMKDLWRANDPSKRPRRDAENSVWKPTFELEDFEEAERIRAHSEGNKPRARKKDEDEDDGQGEGEGDVKRSRLDLNLAI